MHFSTQLIIAVMAASGAMAATRAKANEYKSGDW